MEILDLALAGEVNRDSKGSVLINEMPEIRVGKRNPYMVGHFINQGCSAEFKIWEERTYKTVLDNGPGIYDVEVTGSEYNGYYLTVRRIQPCTDPSLERSDFLPSIPVKQLNAMWKLAFRELRKLGLSEEAIGLAREIVNDPELEGRYSREGAASFHHDNRIGGLAHHSAKMLRILAAVIGNLPPLRKSIDLLFLGVVLHDIGKVFEYKDLAISEFWFSNHRARGIEFLAKYKERICKLYDEKFYRHLQAIIIGHHGDYGDRPTTVATGIIHYIDTLESQATGLVERQIEGRENENIRVPDWGYLAPVDLAGELYSTEAALLADEESEERAETLENAGQ
ncbi:MAG: HD domain-containing protein [Eubacteriales bacterium]|nr:HD domain-containing protein [Eubacteriales bacterium]